MLPRQHRLSTKQFDAVWKRGTSACGAFVCARVLIAQDIKEVRCGCAIPKKHARTIVRRNRLRRRIYGALESIMHTMHIPMHIVITPKTTLNNVSYDALCTDLAKTIAKAHVRAKKR